MIVQTRSQNNSDGWHLAMQAYFSLKIQHIPESGPLAKWFLGNTTLKCKKCRVTKNSSKAVGDKPIIIPGVIEGVPLEMELDTGAAVSIVSYVDYLKHFCHIPLSATTRQLHGYSGSSLVVAGEISVKVKYNVQECQLPMLVVKADKEAPPLFGRSWLQGIKLDWPAIFSQRVNVVKLYDEKAAK